MGFTFPKLLILFPHPRSPSERTSPTEPARVLCLAYLMATKYPAQARSSPVHTRRHRAFLLSAPAPPPELRSLLPQWAPVRHSYQMTASEPSPGRPFPGPTQASWARHQAPPTHFYPYPIHPTHSARPIFMKPQVTVPLKPSCNPLGVT